MSRRPGIRGLSLRAKLPLTITFVVFASALIIGLVVIERDWARQRATLEAQTLELARATAAAGRSFILKKDVWLLYRALKLLQERDPGLSGKTPVIEAAFLDSDGMVLAHTNPAQNPVGLPMNTSDAMASARLEYALQASGAGLVPKTLSSEDFVDAVAPITIDGLTVGFMLLRSSTAGLAEQLRRDTVTVLTFSLGLAVVMSLFGAMISRRVMAPLRELSEGLDAVGRGDLSKAGAADYLTKPFDLDEFVAKAQRAVERMSDLRAAPLEGPDGTMALPSTGVLGRSPALHRIEEIAARIRDVDSTVLVSGESGVGKEVVARFIHRNSARAGGPFVPVNLAGFRGSWWPAICSGWKRVPSPAPTNAAPASSSRPRAARSFSTRSPRSRQRPS